MQLIDKYSFEVRTELRSYHFIISPGGPLEEYLSVLEAVHEHFKKQKDEADAKAKVEEEKPIQE